METFTSFKSVVPNSAFGEQRSRALSQLDIEQIDAPIADVVAGFAQLPYCFTLQSCYGHFVYGDRTDIRNITPLSPSGETTRVEYRIAYLALCIAEGDEGLCLLQDLQDIRKIDPERIQFGCADWFWGRQVNSYALQVEPDRHQNRDSVHISYQEALQIQSARDAFFARLRELIDVRLDDS